MRPGSLPILPEQWPQIEDLFDRLMEASDPEAVFRTVPDPAVAEVIRRLWSAQDMAAGRGFLSEPITLVRRFWTIDEPAFVPGQVLADRFRVERLLGAGGMGEVYLAWDSRLHEQVALKTVRRALVNDRAILRRFLAEVQNARRVTHPNVCRIYDLFNEGDLPFFTMQYLEGMPLSDWLALPEPHQNSTRRRIALELAEGLYAAHRAGILHCDFKPSNIILTGSMENPVSHITDFGLARAFYGASQTGEGAGAALSLVAGTRGYVAPEVKDGGPAEARSDIYSYGKVLSELLPKHQLAARCSAQLPADRPATLDPVLRAFGGSNRRWWVASSVTAVTCAFVGAYSLASRRRLVLASRQRVIVNGFQPEGSRSAFVVRDLLITALRQSPLLMVVSDDRIRALLRALKSEAKLPARSSTLLAAAARENALVIEGVLEPLRAGLRLAVQVFPEGETKAALRLSEEVNDARNVVELADRVAKRLRHEMGESDGSLRLGTGYTPLAQVTSSSPEAVELYYRGLDEYDQAHARAALEWFKKAVEEDPNFVLAQMQIGITLASQDELASALPYYQTAYRLRGPLSQRERLWIEGRYFNIIRDYVTSLDICRRLVVLFPEEATFQRNVAFAATRVGRPQDALPFSQRAIELDPANENGLSEWLVNHCDANQYDVALAKYRQFREDGHTSTLLDYGAGIAHTGKGEFLEAVRAFDRMGTAPERERWSRLQRCIPLIASGRWAEAASQLASDIAFDAVVGEELRQMDRRLWLGMLHVWMDEPSRALSQAEILCGSEPSPAWLPSLRMGSMLAIEIGHRQLAHQVLNALRKVEDDFPSTDSHGCRALLQGLLLANDDRDAALTLLVQARGLWPDPITLYGVGRFQNRYRDFAGAVSTLEMLEEARGRTYRLFFPGLVGLGRVECARALSGLSRFRDAARLYKRVLDDWGDGVNVYGMARQVRREYEKLISMQARTQGDRHAGFLGNDGTARNG